LTLPRLLAVLGLVLLVSACNVGPDFLRPKPPAVTGYTQGALPAQTLGAKKSAAQRFLPGRDIPQEWWRVFHSKQLDALIAQSLEANPDVQAAESALRVAQENVRAQQGYYAPTLTAGASASRQRVAPNVAASSPLPSGAPVFSLYTGQVTVAYAPDVLGLNRRSVESLQAQAEAQNFQLIAARLSLSSNVVAAAIQEAALRAEIAATQDIVAANARMLEVLRGQFRHGYASAADVAAQETQLAQARALLPPLQKQLAQNRDLLTALAGRLSADEIAQTFELSRLTLPHDLPLSLPSKLVDQRPDVRAAEAQLHAASANIGIAAANRLPQFTIAAGAGDIGTMLSHLAGPAGAFWSLAGGAAQTIFAGGTLLHRQKSAEAAYEQAAAQYRSTVIGAFQNVADVLNAIRYDADSEKAAAAAASAAKTSLDVADRQFKAGYGTYLALLTAQQAYQQTRLALVQAEAARYADTAALYQALGGGWWNNKSSAPGDGDSHPRQARKKAA
jgi:NodT family efflux transporter outer membrane factor (OMF) lipoprotein